MIRRVKHFWLALLAGGLAVCTGLGAFARALYRAHHWRVHHEPGPIA